MKVIVTILSLLAISYTANAVQCKSDDGKTIDVTMDPGSISFWQGDKQIDQFDIVENSSRFLLGVPNVYEFSNHKRDTLQANILDLNYMVGSTVIQKGGVIYNCPRE